MDPITAVGAAGSVVGIASFGLQLSQTLYQYISSSRGANASVRAVMDGVNATTGAMDQVRGLLDDENERIALDGKAVLFSAKALEDIKCIVDQCLIIFWRVEATITGKDDSTSSDPVLEARLAIFNDEIMVKKPSRLLKLDSMLILSKMQCLRWPFVAPKLKDYGHQLNGLQVNLILMFQVVSMRAKTVIPNQKAADVKVIYEMYARIEQTAAQADLAEINPRFGHLPLIQDQNDFSGKRRRLRSHADIALVSGGNVPVPMPPPRRGRGMESQSTNSIRHAPHRVRHGSPAATSASHIYKEPKSEDFAPVLPDKEEGMQNQQLPSTAQDFDVDETSDVTSIRGGGDEYLAGTGGSGQGKGKGRLTAFHNLTSAPEGLPSKEIAEPARALFPNLLIHSTTQGAMSPINVKSTVQPTIIASAQSNYRSPYITEDVIDHEEMGNVSQETCDEIESVDKAGSETLFTTMPQPKDLKLTRSMAEQHRNSSIDKQSPPVPILRRQSKRVFNSTPPHWTGSSNSHAFVDNRQQALSTGTDNKVEVTHLGQLPDDSRKTKDATVLEPPTPDSATTRSERLSGHKSRSDFRGVGSEKSETATIFATTDYSGQDSKRLENEGVFTAYIIKDGSTFEVPYTELLPQARTKSFLAKTGGNPTWWRTFAFLCDEEMSAVQKLIPESSDQEVRSLVYLERIKKHSIRFWASNEKALLAVVQTFDYTFGRGNNLSLASRSWGVDNRKENNFSKNAEFVPKHQKVDLEEKTSQVDQISRTAQTNHQAGPNSVKPKAVSGMPMSFTGSAPPPPTPPFPRPGPGPDQGPYAPPGSGTHQGPFPQSILRNPSVNPVRITDITPQKLMDAQLCLEALTTYALYTIQKVGASDLNEDKGWARCSVTREPLTESEISNRLEELNDTGTPVFQKKLRLHPHQQEQITQLVHQTALSETDVNFEWTLAQLDFTTTRFSLRRQHTTPLTVILRRGLKRGLDSVLIYQAIQRSKNGPGGLGPQRQVQQQVPQQHFHYPAPPLPPPPPPLQRAQGPHQYQPHPNPFVKLGPKTSVASKYGIGGKKGNARLNKPTDTDSNNDSSSDYSEISSISNDSGSVRDLASSRLPRFRSLSPRRAQSARHNGRLNIPPPYQTRSKAYPFVTSVSTRPRSTDPPLGNYYDESYSPENYDLTRELGGYQDTYGNPFVETSLPRGSNDDSYAAFDDRLHVRMATDPAQLSSRYYYPARPRENDRDEPDGPRSERRSFGRPAYLDSYDTGLYDARNGGRDREIPANRVEIWDSLNDSSKHRRSSDYPPDMRMHKKFPYPQYYDNKPYNPVASQVPNESEEAAGSDIVQQLLLEWTPAEGEKAESTASTEQNNEHQTRKLISRPPEALAARGPGNPAKTNPMTRTDPKLSLNGVRDSDSNARSSRFKPHSPVSKPDTRPKSIVSEQSWSGDEPTMAFPRLARPVPPLYDQQPPFITARRFREEDFSSPKVPFTFSDDTDYFYDARRRRPPHEVSEVSESRYTIPNPNRRSVFGEAVLPPSPELRYSSPIPLLRRNVVPIPLRTHPRDRAW